MNGHYHLPVRILFPLVVLVSLFIKRQQFRYVLMALSEVGMMAFFYDQFFNKYSSVMSGFYFTKTIINELGLQSNDLLFLILISIPVFIYPILFIFSFTKPAKRFYISK